MDSTYVSSKIATEILGIHQSTLYQWGEKKIIDTIKTGPNNGKRLYNVKKYLESKELNISNVLTVNNPIINNLLQNIKRNYIYVRVSSIDKKDELESQIKFLTNNYPNHNIIKDIGNGINLNRKGLLKLINLAIEGKINQLVVIHKDCLCKFCYELIEFLVSKYSNGEIIILENDNEPEDLKEEMVDDMLYLMNAFVSKLK